MYNTCIDLSIPLQAACITKLRDLLMRHRKDYINSAGYVSMYMYVHLYNYNNMYIEARGGREEGKVVGKSLVCGRRWERESGDAIA